MTLLEWLRKLGIVRWGATAGVYRNAVERPLELQQPDVFSADHDLTVGGAKRDAGSLRRPPTPIAGATGIGGERCRESSS